MKEILRQVIFEQRERSARPTGTAFPEIPRKLPQALMDCPEILIISGIRRCGKSTLLRQICESRQERDFYLNFDDERLINFSVEDFQILHEVFIELFGEQHTFYFDEIQNVAGWERFVRRLADAGAKIFITGSNASMLSRELGTHLTGRFVRHELYPFSFGEFLRFRGNYPADSDFFTTSGRAKLSAEVQAYLRLGGFPQYIAGENDDYVKALYEGIVYRDVLVRNRFMGERELRELGYFLASNAAKRFSYVSVAKAVGLKHSETAKNYIAALENSYLVSQVVKFDYSAKKQIANEKKIYFADPALIRKIGFNPTENTGPIFENVVYTELRRRGCDVFYHIGKKECDFVLRGARGIEAAVQACATMRAAETREREIAGLLDALDTYGLDAGTIVTLDEAGEFSREGKRIFVRPLAEWLLGK